jgi:hypothetical protein
MSVVDQQVICDTTTFLDWLIAGGTISTAVVAAIGTGIALRIANQDRKDRDAERDRTERREAQAQADLVIVGFGGPKVPEIAARQEPRLKRQMVVQNFSGFPILDVTFEAWPMPYEDGKSPDHSTKLIAPTNGKSTPIELTISVREEEPYLYAERAKWRDHYGRIWVRNRHDSKPEEYDGQLPKPLANRDSKGR